MYMNVKDKSPMFRETLDSTRLWSPTLATLGGAMIRCDANGLTAASSKRSMLKTSAGLCDGRRDKDGRMVEACPVPSQ